MTRTLRIALTAAAATVAAAGPAQAQQPAPAPVTTKYFFQCTGTNKVQNNGPAAKWSTVAPTASYTAGGGCGFFDQPLLVSTVGGGNTLVDAVFEGTHTGPVSAVNVELHDLLLSQHESAITSGVAIEAVLSVDGNEVLNTLDDPAAFSVVPVPSATGLTQAVKFGVSGLKVTDAAEHDYQLTINVHYSDAQAAWVFGATEIPAGIEFNPLKTAKPTLKAT